MSLKVLRDPSGSKVDIVFVHGWHGDQAPWTSAQNSVFWPEKLLAAKIPEARILSFEYDVTIEAFWNEEDLVSDFSNDLMDALMEQRTKKEEENRAVILVAHCLGGLVCEKALATGSQHDERKKLVSCVQGLLLLGTPHFQPDTLPAAMKYFQLAQKEIPKDSELKERSQWVISIPQQFASLRKSGAQISVECFYEGSAMSVNDDNVKIVDMFLAQCLDGPPPDRLGGNHQQISQFESDNNRDFIKVSRVLVRWVAKIPSPEKKGTVNYIANARFSGENHGMQLGQNAGTISGFRFGERTRTSSANGSA
ncbi:hypothetical protein BDW59DRAFT_138918 [Aspergillus cavernicola]|uniref:GPI inositol-deacylase n=1 Tax=Aspergillus cavernicola TaxID=176166 RepID=A0ABR4IYR8_9EURO